MLRVTSNLLGATNYVLSITHNLLLGTFFWLADLAINGICTHSSGCILLEGTPPTDLTLPDIFDLPGEYVPMSHEIFSAVSAGKKEWLEILRGYGKPMASLKSDQGDSVLHLAAAWGHLELVKSIVSECPSLLLEPDSKDQLPLHVAVRAGRSAVVKALVATIKFVSARMSEEGRGSPNPYVVKDKDGNTALHLALKDLNLENIARLVLADQESLFLANKDGISALYMAVETRCLFEHMLKTTGNDGPEGRYLNLDLVLEGRKCLVHAALKARDEDILKAILKEYPCFEDKRDEEGKTSLSFGASIGFYEGVCILLDRSTESVYVCNDDGSFPIHIATENQHMKVVEEILKRCPDSIHLLNKQGQNLFHIVAKSGITASKFLPYLSGTNRKKPMMEKQDVDGNTPLHLATINWRPITLLRFLLSSKLKRSLYIRNNTGLTILDIVELNLQPSYIFMERLTLMVILFFYALVPRRSSYTKWRRSITIPSVPPAAEKMTYYINILLVVAALVATVTFAAGSTIPGGFHSSGPKLGRAALARDPALVLFMVFDTLAMHSSILTIATLIWAQLGDPALAQKALHVALPLLFLALLLMSATFFCGVVVAFGHVTLLVIFLCISFLVFLSTMLFILGPHILLQIPGVPVYIGLYFASFILYVDEDSYVQSSAAQISGSDLKEKQESS